MASHPFLFFQRLIMAERVGFEPTDPFGSTVFETARFGHSRTSPLLTCSLIEGMVADGVIWKKMFVTSFSIHRRIGHFPL